MYIHRFIFIHVHLSMILVHHVIYTQQYINLSPSLSFVIHIYIYIQYILSLVSLDMSFPANIFLVKLPFTKKHMEMNAWPRHRVTMGHRPSQDQHPND